MEMQLALKSLQELIEVQEEIQAPHIWGNYVHHLELVWKKTERSLVDVRNKFEPFQGKFTNKRRKDSLLSFLFQSRHFHEHEAKELIGLTFTNQKILLNRHLVTNDVDENDNIIPGTERIAHYFLSHLRLKDFYINDRTWVTPADHNGKMLNDVGNPYEVAYHGCLFYLDFLFQTDKKFLDSQNSQIIVNMMASNTLGVAQNFKGPSIFATDFIPVKGGRRMINEDRPGLYLDGTDSYAV